MTTDQINMAPGVGQNPVRDGVALLPARRSIRFA